MACPKCGGPNNAWYLCTSCRIKDNKQKIKESARREKEQREEVQSRNYMCKQCGRTQTQATDGLCRACARAQGINYG